MPVKPAGAHLDGLDALLSIVQASRGRELLMRSEQLSCAFSLGIHSSCKPLTSPCFKPALTHSFLRACPPHCLPQMPKGVPVATVAIGNAANAGLLAVRRCCAILCTIHPAAL